MIWLTNLQNLHQLLLALWIHPLQVLLRQFPNVAIFSYQLTVPRLTLLNILQPIQILRQSQPVIHYLIVSNLFETLKRNHQLEQHRWAYHSY